MANEWRKHAECLKRGLDLDMFFDAYEQEVSVQLIVDEACAACPVQDQCLEWAIDNNVEFGVWGRKYFNSNMKSGKKKALQKV